VISSRGKQTVWSLPAPNGRRGRGVFRSVRSIKAQGQTLHKVVAVTPSKWNGVYCGVSSALHQFLQANVVLSIIGWFLCEFVAPRWRKEVEGFTYCKLLLRLLLLPPSIFFLFLKYYSSSSDEFIQISLILLDFNSECLI